MFLAAILLKTGSFAVYQFRGYLPSPAQHLFRGPILLGACVASIVTSLQEDVKALIAYSRVVHMGLPTYSLVLLDGRSTPPALMMLVAHGIASSGLFYMSFVSYSRTHTRSLYLDVNRLWSSPPSSSLWVGVVLLNIGIPPTLNFFSELLLVGVSLQHAKGWLLPLLVLLARSLVYNILVLRST